MPWHEEYKRGLADVAEALNAIAEQQRVANMLAVAQFEWKSGNETLATSAAVARELRDAAHRLVMREPSDAGGES